MYKFFKKDNALEGLLTLEQLIERTKEENPDIKDIKLYEKKICLRIYKLPLKTLNSI